MRGRTSAVVAAIALVVPTMMRAPSGLAELPAPAGFSLPTNATPQPAKATLAKVTVQPGKATRVCDAADRPGVMSCDAMIVQPATGSGTDADADAAPNGYGPADLDSAYALPSTGGAGATVAVVDAFNNPRAASDLAVYRSRFGLPACTIASGCFTQVNQDGSAAALPANDAGWAGEESLDVDMVSAICPACHIILVEASSAADANLFRAEDEAVALGAGYVSNSWGDPDDSGQTGNDLHFNHPGVVITASTGDDGEGVQYPATSPDVTAVGGTSLRRASNVRGWTESAWSGAGSGCALDEAKAPWQGVSTGCAGRAEADVSAVADPRAGVAVYQTFGAGGWVTYGGTSVAAPLIASVYALAGPPAAGTYPASYPYADADALFDVMSGSNGFCGSAVCNAGPSWDGPTGLGTPDGTAAFTATSSPTPLPIPSTPAPPLPSPPLPSPPWPTCVPAQLLGNPGFEAGIAAPWTTTPAHSGSWDAWLDGYGSTHTDTRSSLSVN